MQLKITTNLIWILWKGTYLQVESEHIIFYSFILAFNSELQYYYWKSYFVSLNFLKNFDQYCCIIGLIGLTFYLKDKA